MRYVSFQLQKNAQEKCNKINAHLFVINSHTEFLSVISFYLMNTNFEQKTIILLGLESQHKVRKEKYNNVANASIYLQSSGSFSNISREAPGLMAHHLP